MTSVFKIAQISDCHLYADKNARHYGANVYQNLRLLLKKIAADPSINIVIFTGDLSQDHSELSYRNFVEVVDQCQLSIPFYFITGNHDQPELLTKYLINRPFSEGKLIKQGNWQIVLINSKSDTPAGLVSEQSLAYINNVVDKDKYQFIFMHHHPIDIGYFIDQHGLKNKEQFWQMVSQNLSIKAIACGHVHNERKLIKNLSGRLIAVLTCPATSIQFDPNSTEVKALLPLQAGYRDICLHDNGCFTTTTHFI